MKIRRDIASIPKRTAAETWRAIVDLITGPGSVDKSTLDAASSIMEALITDEHPATKPIVIKGVGSRLVVYLLYDSEAMEAEMEVDKLTWNPTAGDWNMTAPTSADEVVWMMDSLKTRAPRIKVHDVEEPVDDKDEDQPQSTKLTIDWGALS